MAEENKSPQTVIGIGASAGGLEALEIFFDEFPIHSGAALVVIQHLSPDFKSLMGELLARHTSMNIIRVEDQEVIRPNTVYLISPNKNIHVRGKTLYASSFDPKRHLRHPIDHFLHTLADEYGERAIAVILSGTGSDGTKGTSSIKKQGGLVIAQSPDSCKFDGMPLSVIKAGNADQILMPHEIPSAIMSHLGHCIPGEDGLFADGSNETYQEILDLLKEYEGVDFSRYRPSTISRRIERRLHLSHLNSLEVYLNLLRNNPLELRELHSELLIGVTRFFRDIEAFDELRDTILPNILGHDEDRPVRIWSAGCSTGEEAYSLAILIHELCDQHGYSKNIKIFATDVDREAISIASQGLYPASIVKDMDPGRLEKYFIKQEHGYQICNSIRTTIIFSQHNVTKDPPFTNLDLVVCRNLLIYFQPKLQHRVLSLLHFGLRVDGYLFLGKSEALGDLSREFETIHPTLKLFRKLHDNKLSLMPELEVSNHLHVHSRDRFRNRIEQVRFIGGIAPKDAQVSTVYEELLNEYVPPSILIDENFNLIHTFGNSYKFLDIPRGRSTLDIQRMLPKELAIALSMAVHKARNSNEIAYFKDINLEIDGKPRTIELKVRALAKHETQGPASYLITFEDQRPKAKGDENSGVSAVSYDANLHHLEKIKVLEDQLRITKASLQSTIEELETTNEELQSTNEELMSSNEELQSSNEELHSVNEELYTVNSEYQSKIRELTTANNDIDFLLKSINIGLIFLDQKLRIRRYNDDIKRFINLMPHDVGRPLTDIKFNLMHDDIAHAIQRVHVSGEAEHLPISLENKDYLVHAIPYFTTDPKYVAIKNNGIPSGIVLTFLDTTKMNADIKRAQDNS